MDSLNMSRYNKILTLREWGKPLLSLRGGARKEDLKELILLGKELEEEMSSGGGLFPFYLEALNSLRGNLATLLNLTLEEVEEIIPPEERRPLSWWSFHFSEFYQRGLLPWSKTLRVSPVLLCENFPEDLLSSEVLLNSDGSWNSELSQEELCELLK